MLPSEIPRFPTNLPVRVFPGVWKLLFWHSDPRMDLRPYLFCLSFYLLYLPYLLLKTMGCLPGCLMSSASIQKLFCGICSAFRCSFSEFVGEKVVSPSYSSAILGPPSQSGFKIIIFFFWQEYHSIDGLFTASNRWCTIPVCFINGDICFDQPSLLLKYSLPLYS